VGDRLEIAFGRAARELLPEGASVLVAVSGGGDSVALLHLLLRRRDLTLSVAHMDHGLRRDSRADRRFVERLARSLSIPCCSDRRDVADSRRRDESPEEAARRVRRRFLLEAASEAGSTHIAVGHTLDDQAETILMRLVRGAGATALTGMAPAGPGPFVRPLLALERAPLRAWLERRSIPYRDDPSNSNLRFDRNRVRRLILPLLAESLNPAAGRHLVQAANRFREDAVYLDRLAGELLDRVSSPRREGGHWLDIRELAREAPALANRAARLVLERAGVDPRRIAARHVAALIGLAGGDGTHLDLPGGVTARRRPRGRVLLEKPPDHE
jgi:tRNA(Ile)-lysidine synthase